MEPNDAARDERDEFCVAVYYAERSCVEFASPTVSGNLIEVSAPLSVMPRRLADTSRGERLRVRFRGKHAKPSPLLDAAVVDKQRILGRHLLRLEVVEWDKLARYWRSLIQAPPRRRTTVASA